ncbi:MAG: hypothetical protein LBF61_09415 [Azoarcus sp.]|jgi:hypothetical protein|nr:hypothetical protein [Azoarcus sp.]
MSALEAQHTALNALQILCLEQRREEAVLSGRDMLSLLELFLMQCEAALS